METLGSFLDNLEEEESVDLTEQEIKRFRADILGVDARKSLIEKFKLEDLGGGTLGTCHIGNGELEMTKEFKHLNSKNVKRQTEIIKHTAIHEIKHYDFDFNPTIKLYSNAVIETLTEEAVMAENNFEDFAYKSERVRTKRIFKQAGYEFAEIVNWRDQKDNQKINEATEAAENATGEKFDR